MREFFGELRRRNVFRVGTAYAVVAWLLIQAADIMLGNFGAPAWVFKSIAVLLVLGFPIALLLAWAYELTPEGLRRSASLESGQESAPGQARRIDNLVIVVLALALGWFAWDKFSAGTPPFAVQAAGAAPSVAVLPFTNISADREQDYLADGLAEELLNLLAGIRGLKVTGRTSSFSFKGKDTPVPEIGRILGVGHVLEGSVRKSGDRLRITAQLLEADTGFHVWSESFDRGLEDIFTIQDEIAGAIARALEVTLTGHAVGTPSLEAYDLLLRARSLIDGRSRDGLQQARTLVDRALALDPAYPPALAASGELWLLLSDRTTTYGDIPARDAEAAARRDLQRAIALEPELAEAHAGLGLWHLNQGEFAAAERHLTHALGINPSLTGARNWLALTMNRMGRAREALAAAQRLAELDPLFVTNRMNLVYQLVELGDHDGAERSLQRMRVEFPGTDAAWTPTILLRLDQGRLAEAYAAQLRALELNPGRRMTSVFSGAVQYGLGEYENAISLGPGWFELRSLFATGRAPASVALARERLPGGPDSAIDLLEILALAGEHQELLAWVAEHWRDSAALNDAVPFSWSMGSTLAPVAIAQRSLGRTEALAETLKIWRDTMAFMAANGHASAQFRYSEARLHALEGDRAGALARLAEAIDLGFRDPLPALDRATTDLHLDPEFLAQAERMRGLINLERGKLGMEPLR
jgi:TolB-like protein/Tfp pilus assembly protein PilF